MKVCYFDESGTGEEPVAVVTGVVVDAQRMHVTKEHWSELLDVLSGLCGRKLDELHTKDFYAGNSPFKKMDGPTRSNTFLRSFHGSANASTILCTAQCTKQNMRDPGLPGSCTPNYQRLGLLVHSTACSLSSEHINAKRRRAAIPC